MLGSRANVGWVSEMIRSKLSSGSPLLVLWTVFAGVPEFGAISGSIVKQPKRYAPAFSRRGSRPSFEKTVRPREIEGAGKAGCSLHPQPRVRNKTKHTSE